MTLALPADDVAVRRDVVYAQIEGHRPLSLDLFEPHHAAQVLCVYLHGGGWRVGSRRAGPGPLSPTSSRSFTRLAQHGVAVASIDYRLSAEARFPAQSHDVVAGCRWLLEQPAFVKLPLVVFGVSAGGHLAALAALDRSLPVRRAAIWYAVTDLLAMPEDLAAVGGDVDRGPNSREAMLLGGPASEHPDAARSASPVAHVHSAAPPFLLLHGDADVLVPMHQSVRLHDALRGAGCVSVFEAIPGYNHMFRGMPDGELDALIDRTATFLLEAAIR